MYIALTFLLPLHSLISSLIWLVKSGVVARVVVTVVAIRLLRRLYLSCTRVTPEKISLEKRNIVITVRFA